MNCTCHGPLQDLQQGVDLSIALAGNPNVGKSSIFNRLTGMGVETANYPGKTVELQFARTRFGDQTLGVIDLPGTYALDGISEDQWVARRALLDGKPDAVILVLDATNLARNLYLGLQVLDLGLPLVAALNVVDQAEARGIQIDAHRLAEILGSPVVPTVGSRGTGLDQLMVHAVEQATRRLVLRRRVRYSDDVEFAIGKLERLLARRSDLPCGLPARAVALLLLEGDSGVTGWLESAPEAEEVLTLRDELTASLRDQRGEDAGMLLSRERHGLAGLIASEVETREPPRPLLADRLWRITTGPWTGLPILGVVLAGIFGLLFYVGDWLSVGFNTLWTSAASPVIQWPIHILLGEGALAKTLLWGFDAGINAALSVGIPYVLVFYFLLALLEDSGYLNAVAFLTDQVMHKMGLHGRAMIPLVAAAGCNVPAIMGTRVLGSMRERIIASTLVILTPCSARTAVILGAVSLTAGWRAALGVYAVTALLAILTGIGLHRVLPGQGTGLVMEMFPFRRPALRPILRKTWMRFHHFAVVATPIVVGGSIVLGGLYETGLLWHLTAPLRPIFEGWLGLPAVAGLTLVIAVLRKELALQLLVTLAMIQYGPQAVNLLTFMRPDQIVVYALVNTIYVPCLATIAILGRELGWRRALLISGFTFGLALAAGGAVRPLAHFLLG
ncbi:MAG: ferrous iron transport protein B [candidate division NC10 bacterium]|nr:ferrous iron transport protein B [candidate division NC10 bacterium]